MCTVLSGHRLATKPGKFTQSRTTNRVSLQECKPPPSVTRVRAARTQACLGAEQPDTRRQVLLQAGALSLCSSLPARSAPVHPADTTSHDEGMCHRLGPAAISLAKAQSINTVAKQYDSYAAEYDQLDTGAAAEAFGIPDLRRQLLSKASGRVLEVAIGTGINLPLYDRQQVQSLTGVDISPGMLQQAQSKSSNSGAGLQVTLQQGDVEALPFELDSFDCVVDTFSLCVFPKPLLALQQMARVLRPGGKLLLLEHSRSNFPPLGLYQDITARAVAALGKGCFWNQDVKSMLAEAGFQPTKLQTTLGGLITAVEAKKLTP